MRNLALSILGALVVCLACVESAPFTRAAPAEDARPRLVVVLVVDQMRTDYLERYGGGWTDGLKRLRDNGTWFTDAAYPYLNTVTCAGHSTIGTGRFPREHGMVLNGWFERREGRTTLCTETPGENTITPSGVLAQPRSDGPGRLRVPTLAERIKDRGGRVVTISLKPRSAIGLAGRGSDATIWFGGTGTFVTSTAYGDRLPPFVAETLERNPIAGARTAPWVKLLAPDRYSGTDDGLGERPPLGWSTVFPHPLDHERFIALWQLSPSADAYLARLAAAAIDSYKLGMDDKVDFLGVSFSTLDVVGHAFGPESHEIQDILAHLDRTIGTLLGALDERIGRGYYVVALTSDHGVAPIPEQSVAAGLPAGRINAQEVANAVEAALEPHLGKGPHIATLLYTDLYFGPGVWNKIRSNREALAAVRKAMLAVPGVERVFTADELKRVDDGDPVQRAAALSWFEERSGDMILVPRQYWIASAAATTHGTLHPYDQRVPVIFFGQGIPPGRRPDTGITPADVAPTLAQLAGLTFRNTNGRALPVATPSQ